MTNWRDLLEPFNMVEPGEIALAWIDAGTGFRYLSKERLQKYGYTCAWCSVKPVPDKRHKYCSNDCKVSGNFHFYPQAPATKAWVLVVRQQCACAGCGLSYEPEIAEKVRRIHASEVKNWPKHWAPPVVSYFRIGCNTGHIWHVDHINPLFKGGKGVGLENIQVLCVRCHKMKSAAERKR